jgi:imidazolonepropionase-like amidohydrolase
VSRPRVNPGSGGGAAAGPIINRGGVRAAVGVDGPMRQMLRRAGLAAVLCATATAAPAQQPQTTLASRYAPEAGATVQVPRGAVVHPKGTLFIRDVDTVWTAAGQVLAPASILIRDGRIAAIGAQLQAPAGAQVIDGRGMHAMPGIVDEHSHTAMSSSNEGTAPIVPEVRVIDALSAEDINIYRALSGGVTTARIMHGSANPIGGQSATIKMRWGMDRADQLLLDGAPPFVKFALGENVTRKNFRTAGAPVRYPASRTGVEAIYDQAFTAAQAYRAEWQRYRRDARLFRVPPRRDLRLEALVDIMEGNIRIHAHSYRSDEILMLMRVAERHGFRIDVFTHVLEGYKVASELAAHGAAASTFSDWWHYKIEAFDAIPHNATLMQRKGILTAINSDIPWLQSFMHLEIPKPVKYGGATQEEALRMLTLNPAKMMKIDDRVGSLEVGKDGDVVLLNGSPFSAYSRVEKTIVDGIVYYDLAREAETRKEPYNPLPEAKRPVIAGQPALQEKAAPPPPPAGPLVATTGGTVHPVSGPPIPDGVVLLRGDRILEVGSAARVQVPPDARRVDASGRHVYPGMIDPVTALGLSAVGSVGAATDEQDTGLLNPHLRAIVAVHPFDAAIGVARANGITTALTRQGGGIVSGIAGVIELGDADTWERMAVRQEAALVVNFPAPRERGGDAAGGRRRPGSAWEDFDHDFHADGPDEHDHEQTAATAEQRLAAEAGEAPTLAGERMEKLVDLFRRARAYARQPTTSDDPTAPFEANLWGGDRVMLESLLPVLDGSRPVMFQADSEWQLRTLFVFLDTFPELRPIVVGGAQGYKVADELARRRIPVIITSAYSPTPDRNESITASWRNAALLHAAGVRVAFGTGSVADVRNLPYHAAHSAAFGLPKAEALRAVTLNAAEILGLGHELGSLEAGKRADLLITDGDPLEIVTRVHTLFIGGREIDPADNRHDQLYRRFKDRE